MRSLGIRQDCDRAEGAGAGIPDCLSNRPRDSASTARRAVPAAPPTPPLPARPANPRGGPAHSRAPLGKFNLTASPLADLGGRGLESWDSRFGVLGCSGGRRQEDADVHQSPGGRPKPGQVARDGRSRGVFRIAPLRPPLCSGDRVPSPDSAPSTPRWRVRRRFPGCFRAHLVGDTSEQRRRDRQYLDPTVEHLRDHLRWSWISHAHTFAQTLPASVTLLPSKPLRVGLLERWSPQMGIQSPDLHSTHGGN